MESLCVFCGASPGKGERYASAARELGHLLAERSLRLVFGGGHVGLMGTVADACLEKGGTVWGIMPKNLVDRELAHSGLSKLIVVDTLHERKALMNRHSDGFLVLPGGLGTLEELFEIVSWSQLGLIQKPTCLVNTDGFWDRILAAVDYQMSEGFLSPESRKLLLSASTPRDALEAVISHASLDYDRWGR